MINNELPGEQSMMHGGAEVIKDLEHQRVQAVSSSDVVALRELIAPTCSYVHTTGRTDTGATYLDQLAAGHFAYEAIDVDEQTITVTNGVAVVVYRQVARMQIGLDRHTAVTRCTAVWAGGLGASQLVAFQASQIRQVP